VFWYRRTYTVWRMCRIERVDFFHLLALLRNWFTFNKRLNKPYLKAYYKAYLNVYNVIIGVLADLSPFITLTADDIFKLVWSVVFEFRLTEVLQVIL